MCGKTEKTAYEAYCQESNRYIYETEYYKADSAICRMYRDSIVVEVDTVHRTQTFDAHTRYFLLAEHYAKKEFFKALLK
uniref:Uncharacterized protein n=1 Tax=viral metagenome TaxID=1070528 RepID=A0A6H1ZGS9_9ZZZZ